MSEYKGKRVLSIGARKNILSKLTDGLHQQGFNASWSDNTTNIEQIPKQYRSSDYDVIAFGRGVKSQQKQLLRRIYKAQNPTIEFVDGLAPIPNLLIEQIKLACRPKNLNRFTIEIVDAKDLQINSYEDCHLIIKHYKLNWLFQSKENTIFDGNLNKAQLSIPIKRSGGKNFIVIFQNGAVADVSVIK